MKLTVVSLIQALTKFVVGLAFLVVIFAATGAPINVHPHGAVDFLMFSWQSRFISAFIMTGVFGWVVCFDAKPFWLRSTSASSAIATNPNRVDN